MADSRRMHVPSTTQIRHHHIVICGPVYYHPIYPIHSSVHPLTQKQFRTNENEAITNDFSKSFISPAQVVVEEEEEQEGEEWEPILLGCCSCVRRRIRTHEENGQGVEKLTTRLDDHAEGVIVNGTCVEVVMYRVRGRIAD